MKHIIIVLLVFAGSIETQAQFWVGPKIGGSLTSNIYDDKSYRDNYKVSPNLNWEAGLSMDYDSDGRFMVHTELTYQRVGNKVTNLAGEPELEATSTYHFVSVPLMVRVIFVGTGRAINFYGQAGPRLKFWLAGNGQTLADEFQEFAAADGTSYKVEFKSVENRSGAGTGAIELIDGKDIIPGAEFIVEQPNRVQYSLDIGGGVFIDLRNRQRINIDLRYSFGHSNMGFNIPEDGLQMEEFDEDLEYHHNMFTVSLGYLFSYDPLYNKKGKSTNSVSNKKKRKR